MKRLVVALLFALAVLGTATPAATAQPAPPSTAPTGPSLDAPTEGDVATSKNKLIIGVAAVALLGIVVYGNRVRAKRRKG